MTRWEQVSGGEAGGAYAERFARLAASGVDVHGEASFCVALVPPGSRVVDAGCGTGRVAVRLAELGYLCVGVDLDASMLAVARRLDPRVRWVQADLADLDVPDLVAAGAFDLVVAAGNVMPFLASGSEPAAVAGLAAVLRPRGLLVAGFGLDDDHLPAGAAHLELAAYDGWCVAAGLEPVARHATWAGDPYEGGGYAVSVHRRPPG
jgi:SAM-dependent methyltransferase